MNRTIRIALSIAISAVFLGFAIRKVDWAEAAAALAAAHYIYVVPMFGVTIWTLYIRAQRWRLLLRPVGTPAMRTLVAATNIGFMANMVLPLRIGEVIRPVLVSRKENKPLSGILATVVLERIFDMFTILFLFGVSTSLVAVSEQVRHWGYYLCRSRGGGRRRGDGGALAREARLAPVAAGAAAVAGGNQQSGGPLLSRLRAGVGNVAKPVDFLTVARLVAPL